jgi:hypothetical protein
MQSAGITERPGTIWSTTPFGGFGSLAAMTTARRSCFPSSLLRISARKSSTAFEFFLIQAYVVLIIRMFSPHCLTMSLLSQRMLLIQNSIAYPKQGILTPALGL